MARWEPIIVAAVAVGFQVIPLPRIEPWSPTSLFFGLAAGVLIAPLSELRYDVRELVGKAGCRRTLIWALALVVWTIATEAVVFALAFAAGLDKIRL